MLVVAVVPGFTGSVRAGGDNSVDVVERDHPDIGLLLDRLRNLTTRTGR
jgi:hypothetical protein